MDITCVDPQRDPLWHRLVDAHNSSVFHSPAWIRVLTNTYGFHIRAYVLVDAAGEPQAGLPFCLIEDEQGKRMVSLPFSDFCDPLVRNDAEWRLLSEKLMSHGCPVALSCLHTTIPLHQKQPAVVNRARWHGINLSSDTDALWMSLHGSARRAIKKAQRNQLTLRVASTCEELRTFYELHLRIRKYKYHLLAQPYRFFENIWEEFVMQQNGALLLALHQQEIIGGVMFLEWKDTIYYKFNASNPAYVALRPNDFIIWEGMQYGRARGRTSFDFGRTDWDHDGLLHYKCKFASEEKTISFLRYEPTGEAQPQAIPIRRILPQLTELFVDESVPDRVTERAGELLYGLFT